MKDPLEKLISENREAFDDKTPRSSVWSGIERSLFGAKSVSLWNSVGVWRAAAILLMGIVVYLFVNKPASVTGTNGSNRMAAQEFKDIESFYATQISEKVALITNEGL